MRQDFKILQKTLDRTREMTFSNLTCVFVTEGELACQTTQETLILKPGDFIFFNVNQKVVLSPHTIIPNKAFKISVSTSYMVKHYNNFLASQFHCHSLMNDPQIIPHIQKLRSDLSQLIVTFFSGEQVKRIKATIKLQEILLTLIEKFEFKVFDETTLKYSENLNETLAYIHAHYREPIKLGEVAEASFLSASTLSRIFQEQLGIKFTTYINQLRIQTSLNDLLYNQDSIEKIASNYGFSNSKTYRSQFQRFMKMSPTEYKKQFFEAEKEDREKINANPLLIEDSKLDLLLKTVGHEPDTFELIETQVPKTIVHIDSERTKVQQRADIMIHIDGFEALFLDEVKEQILIIKKEIGCHYIVIQELFNHSASSYQMYKDSNFSIYSPFNRFDKIIDFLRTNQLKIHHQIKLNRENYLIQMNSKDLEIYLHFLDYLIRGGDSSIWRVEFQFEKNEIKQNSMIFNNLRNQIKAIHEQIVVGASLPIGYPDYDFKLLEEGEFFKENVLANSEFVGYESEPNRSLERLDYGAYELFTTKDVSKLKHVLESWGVNLPIVLTSWNTLMGDSLYTSGYFFRPGLIVNELSRLDSLVDSYGFWLNTYLFEENKGGLESIDYDGLELFHYHNCRRPTFFALKLYKRLRGEIVAIGKHFILTSIYGNYQLLTWNAQYFSPNLGNETEYLKKFALELEVESSNISDGLYQVKQFLLDKKNGAIFYSYEQFSTRQLLDEEGHEYLSRTTHPRMNIFDIEVKKGKVLSSYLEANSVCLYEFIKIENK